MADLIHLSDRGLYCPAGDFYIDPWKPVDKAVITHAHADHARPGSSHYYATKVSEPILRKRLGDDITFTGYEYGDAFSFKDVRVSLHSAGHILGSAQVRIEHAGQVWVASGDYKRDHDPSCAPFEVVPCDCFITEATFSMPIYHWEPTAEVAREVVQWWNDSAHQDKTCLLFCYSLGKAQRLLAEMTAYTDRTVLLHGAAVQLTEIYREAGIHMLPTAPAVVEGETKSKKDYYGELIIAPPGASGSAWMKRFGNISTGFCSGWMQLRGARRRKGYDRGFVISDHADWESLLRTIKETGCSRVLATHGNTYSLVRFLQEHGINAAALETAYGQPEEEFANSTQTKESA